MCRGVYIYIYIKNGNIKYPDLHLASKEKQTPPSLVILWETRGKITSYGSTLVHLSQRSHFGAQLDFNWLLVAIK